VIYILKWILLKQLPALLNIKQYMKVKARRNNFKKSLIIKVKVKLMSNCNYFLFSSNVGFLYLCFPQVSIFKSKWKNHIQTFKLASYYLSVLFYKYTQTSHPCCALSGKIHCSFGLCAVRKNLFFPFCTPTLTDMQYFCSTFIYNMMMWLGFWKTKTNHQHPR